MAGDIIKSGEVIISERQPVNKLYLITNGKVRVSFPGGTYELVSGDVVGICEIALDLHFLTYETVTDISIIPYAVNNRESIDALLSNNVTVAKLFVRSCIRQLTSIMNYCQRLQIKCDEIYSKIRLNHNTYNNILRSENINPSSFSQIDEYEQYIEEEAVDYWLLAYYNGLDKVYSKEFSKYLLEESEVTIGILRKGCLDVRKTLQLLNDRYDYIVQCIEHIFFLNNKGLFGSILELYNSLSDINKKSILYNNLSILVNDLNDMYLNFSDNIKLKLSESRRILENIKKENLLNKDLKLDKVRTIREELKESLDKILDFAEIDPFSQFEIKKLLNEFKELTDKNAMFDRAVELRKELTSIFYNLYKQIFFKSLNEEPSIPVRMFLYFGYCDEELAGEDNLINLYEITKELSKSEMKNYGIYTFYDWLLAIYRGEKEPSRNEFEVDFAEYVRSEKKANKISEETANRLLGDPIKKIEYELENMFKATNKITFGRISTFCPIFFKDNMLKNVEDCYVRFTEIRKIIAKIKSIDYSAFYREILDTEDGEPMSREYIHIEKLPDFILMPNVGIRGCMWQEIEGKLRATSGRIMLPILHMENLQNTLLRLTAEFRWELCKRVQGGRWNDVTTPSLTSMYCDYVQFYRKNSELSSEAKEKIRLSLQRTKNSFKEMFVRDYISYLIYEVKGSPSLNKVCRQILCTYCPFSKKIMDALSKNPFYSTIIRQITNKNEQKILRLSGIEAKYLREKREVPRNLKREIDFFNGIG